MVYGFKDETTRHYSAVLTLLIKEGNSSTIAYGFLTQETLSPDDFRGLWKCLQEIIPTSYLLIEVLPEHAKIYKAYLPIVNMTKTKTFNGIESEWLKVDMKGELRR